MSTRSGAHDGAVKYAQAAEADEHGTVRQEAAVMLASMWAQVAIADYLHQLVEYAAPIAYQFDQMGGDYPPSISVQGRITTREG